MSQLARNRRNLLFRRRSIRVRSAPDRRRATMPARPNILIVMVDQLNGTLFPDGPAGWLHAPNLKRIAAARRAIRQLLHRKPAMRARPRCLHERTVAVAHRRLRQCGRIRLRHPDVRPSFASRRLCHLPVGQDAFRRAGPVAWLRGAVDHRHLPCRFRLDAGLWQTRRAHRLVVSQHGFGHRRRHCRDHQPARIR